MVSLVVISQHFHPSNVSTAQLITDLVSGLAQSEYDIEVFTSIPAQDPNNDEFGAFNTLKIIRSFSPFQASISIISKIFTSLFFIFHAIFYVLFKVSSQSKLLVVSNPPYAGLIGLIFRLKGGKYLFLFQDIFPESAAFSGILKDQSLSYRFFDRLLAEICKQAQTTVVLSKAMEKRLANKYPSLSETGALAVIENWAIESITPVAKTENTFAHKHHLDQIFTILYSGNIGRLHDIKTIARAIQLLKDEPIQFVFIGDGANRYLLEDLVNVHHLQNLLLLPFQSRHQLSLTLTACDMSLVSLIPGAESIIAPCKLYGMLAAGRGIISVSSAGSYIDELLNQYQCGVNCSPGDPQALADTIKQLLSQPQKVKKFGNNAHQLFKSHYQAERAIREYKQLIFD